MDLSSPAISLLIILYGVFEYRRREKAHGAMVEKIRSGASIAPPVPRSALWKLITTGSVSLLLALFAGGLLDAAMHSGGSSGAPLEIMAAMISVPLLLLVLIFVRDIRRYLLPNHGGTESGA